MNGYSLALLGAGAVIAALNAAAYRDPEGYVFAAAVAGAGLALEVVVRLMRRKRPPSDRDEMT